MNGAAKSIVILDQRANFADAKKIAGEHKGRLPTLQEFVRAIKDPKQLESLRGDWYWTSDDKLPEGYCQIDYEQGALVVKPKKEWDALPSEQKAFVLKGSAPVAISVGEYWFGGRLYGGAAAGPTNGARVALVSL